MRPGALRRPIRSATAARPRLRPRRGRLAPALAAGVLVLAAAACGDDADGTDTGAEPIPAPGGTAFDPEVGEVPVFRGATPIGDTVELADGTTSTTYEVVTAGPRPVIEFYEATMPALGWSVVDPIEEIDTSSWSGVWADGERRVQVTASPLAEGTDEGAETRLTLVLSPPGGGAPATVVPPTVPPTTGA